MTRRSFFSLLGLSWLPSAEPGVDTLRETITIPRDGDPAIGSGAWRTGPWDPGIWRSLRLHALMRGAART